MSVATARPDLAADDKALLMGLRTVLKGSSFDDDFYRDCERVAPHMLPAVRNPMVQWSLRRLERPAALLARLFLYGDDVDGSMLAMVFPEALIGRLREYGMLRQVDGGWRGNMRLCPIAGLWIGSDELHRRDEDPVMGPGPTTIALARAIPENPGRVLDVGCGAGTLALIAASRGAKEAVGVDVLPRAAAWSRFNAALNELPIELHTGDLTVPVKDRQFDLVVSQPPFVVAPPEVKTATYLHGGAMGDEVAMRLIGELPGILAPAGEARLIFESATRPESPLWQRVQGAHGSSEIAQLLFVARGSSPNILALGSAASHHPALDDAYARDAQAYRDHLQAQGIERTEYALVVLGKVSGAPGLSVTIEQDKLERVDADAIDSTWLSMVIASEPDEHLLGRTVGLPPDTWLVHEHAGQGEQARIKLRLPPGRGGDEILSEAAAVLVDLLRTPSPIAHVVERYAAACKTEPAQVHAAVLDFVRQSLVSGRLVVTGPPR
ncbi:MAG: methyltransferase [Myxococcota bacterium]